VVVVVVVPEEENNAVVAVEVVMLVAGGGGWWWWWLGWLWLIAVVAAAAAGARKDRACVHVSTKKKKDDEKHEMEQVDSEINQKKHCLLTHFAVSVSRYHFSSLIVETQCVDVWRVQREFSNKVDLTPLLSDDVVPVPHPNDAVVRPSERQTRLNTWVYPRTVPG
jgi:hypothetical protein